MRKNDNNNVEKLQNKSIDELKGIAKLRRIKNRDKLKKEDLKLESSNAEREYMKHLNNNNTNDGNTDDTYDDTEDSKIREKISDIRMTLSRLGNIITNKHKKKIKKELYEIEKNKTFQIWKKKRFMVILLC